MKNNKLAIAIPTYNRVAILKENILLMLQDIKKYSIPIYISDDSVNTDTEIMIKEIKCNYEYIYYYKNIPSLGHDKNCLRTLELPTEEYVWYMGDSMIIKPSGIDKILKIINFQEYDFICCNAEGRNLNLDTRIFNNGPELFKKLCWHLTMTGATIYSKKQLLNISNFKIEKFKNFPQTAIIFEQFANSKTSLYWNNEKLIYGNSNKKSYWSDKVFEVFINDFKSFVYNLSYKYSIESKDKVISKHTILSGIFNYHSFVKYRINQVYDYKIFKNNKITFKKYTALNSTILFVIACFPNKILKTLYQTMMFFKKWFKK